MKKFISFILAVSLLLSTCCAFASTSFSGNIAGYPVTTKNFKVYQSPSSSTKIGTCYSDDYITIYKIEDGYCKIEYPVSNGTKTGWCKASYILLDDNFNTATGTAMKKITVYETYDCESKLGKIYSGDEVMVVGTKNGNTQVIYPVSKGYKIGFIKGTYAISNGYLKSSSDDSSSSQSRTSSTKATSYKDWKQNDSDWGSMKISTKTMKQVGCATTAVAMLIAKSGLRSTDSFDPGIFLSGMKDNNGYEGNNIRWAKASKVAPGFELYDSYYELDGREKDKFNDLESLSNSGYYIVVAVKNEKHWVAVDYVENGHVYIMDPNSNATDLFDAYDASGVTRCVLYQANW